MRAGSVAAHASTANHCATELHLDFSVGTLTDSDAIERFRSEHRYCRILEMQMSGTTTQPRDALPELKMMPRRPGCQQRGSLQSSDPCAFAQRQVFPRTLSVLLCDQYFISAIARNRSVTNRPQTRPISNGARRPAPMSRESANVKCTRTPCLASSSTECVNGSARCANGIHELRDNTTVCDMTLRGMCVVGTCPPMSTAPGLLRATTRSSSAS